MNSVGFNQCIFWTFNNDFLVQKFQGSCFYTYFINFFKKIEAHLISQSSEKKFIDQFVKLQNVKKLHSENLYYFPFFLLKIKVDSPIKLKWFEV